jgi:signal peptidase II
LGLDLASKGWAKANLDDPHVFPYKKIDVIKDYAAFVFAKNKGGAWGLLQDERESVRVPFFLIISIVAVVFIVGLYRRLSPRQTALKWGLPLVLGGALGNLADRIRYGFVVDFTDLYVREGNWPIFGWHHPELHWPTFNVADVAICVGVGLMAVDMFTSRKASSAQTPLPQKDAASPASSEPAPAPPNDEAKADASRDEPESGAAPESRSPAEPSALSDPASNES